MSTLRAAERVSHFGTSIFAEMSALALQSGAVNLGQGFPDFAGPAWIKEAAAAAIAADLNQYAPYQGLPQLREAIAKTWAAHGWRELDPVREVTITSGATEALFGAIQALLNPGDEAIIFEPFYDAYVPHVTMAGGVPRFVRLHPPRPTGQATGANQTLTPITLEHTASSSTQKPIGTPCSAICNLQSTIVNGITEGAWWFDPDELRAAFTPRTRLLLLNTPHNPTGKVYTQAELALIAELCIEHNVIVIADEVYDQLTFGAATHIPIATLPEMWARTLTINSIGKTFSVTGWKIGYAVGGAALNDALRAAHQWITFATATPLQAAAATALEGALSNGYYAQFRAEYAERYMLLKGILQDANLPPLPTEGSYFILADLAQTNFTSDAAFCRWLISEVGVAAIPPSAFYRDPASAPLLARFCFAKRLETLHAAGERLVRDCS
ncbi:aminotransferase class I/II-fold pyridoxal phosphate-dependent enzyme [Candidatus Viridilinea mediisalina]|uniref:Aminotransferase n=1 Tax=Candidatus Viridilinea mediisalina TaxID=2024553 RepID=A0A2A6RF80_9CHLR|nr:aminotransferase class I/II-fold pyridoxal phosphate-dependent enzyme [Candidatus Viridilinea mediisalina]PDW01539.1 aminotransferase [Candidatus Viridilinea mediisalina]